MQVWNVLHVARWKYRMQKWCKKIAICAPSHNFVKLCLATKAYIDNRKKNLLNSSISSRCPHDMANFGPLTAKIGWRVWGTQHILTGFASWLHYCSYVAHWRQTKLFTMFGRHLGWYTMYTFLWDFAPWQNFAGCRIHFASKSCTLLYWQHYCMALQQWAWAKLCGVVQGMELRNFRRGRHMAGQPSRWASAHILVLIIII